MRAGTVTGIARQIGNGGRVLPEINRVQNLQKMNRIHVVNFIRTQSDVTRAQISEATGLSLSAVTNIVDHLISKDLVVAIGQEETSSVGRKRTKLKYNAHAHSLIEVLIETDSLSAMITSLNGDIQLSRAVSLDGDDDDIVPLLIRTIEELLEEPRYQILGIGVAFSGMILHEGNVTVSSLWQGDEKGHFDHLWETSGLLAQLEDGFGLPVVVENTSRAIARSILERYPDTYMANSLLFDFSVGIGMVYVHDGALVTSLVGEIGHTCIDPQGGRCACGNIGCLEMECSVDAIVSKATQALAEGKCEKLAALRRGRPGAPTYGDILEASREGDQDVNRILVGVGELLGTALANMINIFSPNAVLFQEGRILESDVVVDTAISVAVKRPLKPLAENLVFERVHGNGSDTRRGMAFLLSDRVFDFTTQNDLF